MLRPRSFFAALIVLALAHVLVATGGLRAEPTKGAPGFGAAVPQGASLSGRDIYQRFLDRRVRESLQRLRVISRDPGGSEQTTRFTISTQDHLDDDDQPTAGVKAKMLIEVHDPFDLRHTAYLIISKDPGPDDEFVYQPSQRRVIRADLKNTSLLGTDYTFNDVSFQNIEDAEYTRLPDEKIDGTPVYVVETMVKETIEIEYHKTRLYFEREHFIPIRVRYWDDYGVEVKEMRAPASEIRQFGETWVATHSTMTDLRQRTSSTLIIDHLDPDPDFRKRVFSLTTLSQRH